MDFKNQSFGLLGISEGVIDCWQENWHPHPFYCCQEVLHGPERTWEVAQCPVRAPAPNGHTRKAPRRVGAKPKHCFWRMKEGLFVPQDVPGIEATGPPTPYEHDGRNGKRFLEKGKLGYAGGTKVDVGLLQRFTFHLALALRPRAELGLSQIAHSPQSPSLSLPSVLLSPPGAVFILVGPSHSLSQPLTLLSHIPMSFSLCVTFLVTPVHQFCELHGHTLKNVSNWLLKLPMGF